MTTVNKLDGSAAGPLQSNGREKPFIIRLLPVIVRRLSTRFEDAAKPSFRGLSLDVHGGRVLTALSLLQGQRVGDLALATSLSPSRLSHLLNRLERDGWVRRERADDDSRVVRVFATEKGLLHGADAHRRLLTYEEVALRGFSPPEVAWLYDAIDRMYTNLAEVVEGAPDG